MPYTASVPKYKSLSPPSLARPGLPRVRPGGNPSRRRRGPPPFPPPPRRRQRARPGEAWSALAAPGRSRPFARRARCGPRRLGRGVALAARAAARWFRSTTAWLRCGGRRARGVRLGAGFGRGSARSGTPGGVGRGGAGHGRRPLPRLPAGGASIVTVVVDPLSLAAQLGVLVDGGDLLVDVGGSAGAVGRPVVVGCTWEGGRGLLVPAPGGAVQWLRRGRDRRLWRGRGRHLRRGRGRRLRRGRGLRLLATLSPTWIWPAGPSSR